MYCIKCGTILLSNARFCTQCGYKIINTTQAKKHPVLNPTVNIRFNYEILKRINGCQTGKFIEACPYWDETIVTERVSFFYQNGYIKVSDGYAILPTLTIAELKPMLKQAGLIISGKKADLIQRIKNNISENEIRSLTHGKEIYVLTENGAEHLDNLKQQIELAEFELFDQMYHLILESRFGDAYHLKVEYDRFGVFTNPFSVDSLSPEFAHQYRSLINGADNRQMTALVIIGDMMGYGKEKAKSTMLRFAQKKQILYSSEETEKVYEQIEEIYEQAEYENLIGIHQRELQSYIDCGISRYKILAALDDRTCPKCRQLNGRIFSVKSAKTGINLPPFHKDCRCSTISVFDEEF